MSTVRSLRARALRSASIVAVSLVAAGALAQTDRPLQPEPASTPTVRTLAHAKNAMVAAAHPLAADAGLRMLERGGNAIDAAIAVQLVLGLVEPQSSGLGGGAFLLYHDAKTRAVAAYDGRETAPALATPALFLRDDASPMSFREALAGGRAVGVPGLPRLLEVAHRRHGKLAWATLFEPAIALADGGFPITARLHRMLALATAIDHDPAARSVYFAADGAPKAVGTLLRNPALAQTLKQLALSGADAFYTGAIARDIAAAVRGHATNPGSMSEADLAGYRVREVEPLCTPYRGYRVCGMPPSSSGGIAIAQMLGILANFDLPAVRPGSSAAVHLIAEAGRLAFADRDRYVADDRFVNVPVRALIDPSYLAARAKLIRAEASMGKAQPGALVAPERAHADHLGDTAAGTSHLTVVDAAGNAVTMTTTIESIFGARVMVRGFMLNNQLTDFSFAPSRDGHPVANRVEPGKRPRSSMSPTFVFDTQGRLHLAVGSAGGSNIINYVLKVLVAALDWKLDIQTAIDLPNAGSRNGPTEIEKGSAYEMLAAALRAMQHPVRVSDLTSGTHAIMRTPHGWQGGADPRREGIAKGN